MIYFSTLFIALFTTLAVIPVLKDYAVKLKAIDIPNDRKVHTAPIPKTGGLAMALGTLVPVLLWARFDPFEVSLLVSCALIVTFGFIDDVRDLGYKTKFMAQTCGALIVIIFGGVKISSLSIFGWGLALPDFIAVPLTLILIVGVTNAINLSDGLDGLAGGISLLGFMGIGLLAFLNGDNLIAMFAAAACGAIFGFLVYNTHPASVFMGDAGSQLLGFLSIVLALSLTRQHSVLNPAIPILLLGFPILDTATVMIERILRGVSPFKADKNHFHHKLMRLGLSHKDSVLCIYIIQSAMMVLAFVYRYHTAGFLLIPYITAALAVISGFALAEKYGWRLQSADASDRSFIIPSFVSRKTVVNISFLFIETGLPALLVISGFIATQIPLYMVFFSMGFTSLILLTWRFRPTSLKQVLRITLYLTIPVLAYLGQTRIQGLSSIISHFYSISFFAVLFFVMMTLKYTRRQKGFKRTPMDFLFLFIALALPVLFRELDLSEQIELLSIKILIMFFGFEVLIGELREKYTWLAYPTIATLLLIGVKGVL